MKIGIIDVNTIFDKSRRGRVLTQKLQAAGRVWQTKMQTVDEQRKQVVAQLNAGNGKISVDDAANLQREMQGHELELNYLRQRSDGEIKALVQQSQNVVMQELKPLLAEYAKQNGLTVIFASPGAPILYIEEVADVTQGVLAYYDARVKL